MEIPLKFKWRNLTLAICFVHTFEISCLFYRFFFIHMWVACGLLYGHLRASNNWIMLCRCFFIVLWINWYFETSAIFGFMLIKRLTLFYICTNYLFRPSLNITPLNPSYNFMLCGSGWCFVYRLIYYYYYWYIILYYFKFFGWKLIIFSEM